MRLKNDKLNEINTRDSNALEVDLNTSLNQSFTVRMGIMMLVVTMGSSLQLGYQIALLNQPSTFVKAFLFECYHQKYGDLSEWSMLMFWSLASSMVILGGIVGVCLAGVLVDRIGRKGSLIVGTLPSILGSLLSGLGVHLAIVELFLFGRFVVGINCGMALMLTTIYLSEICAPNLRVQCAAINQTFIALGFLISSLLAIDCILGNEKRWPLLLLVGPLASLVSLLFLPCLSESPNYLLINKEMKSQAINALQYNLNKGDVSLDLSRIEQEAGLDETAGECADTTISRIAASTERKDTGKVDEKIDCKDSASRGEICSWKDIFCSSQQRRPLFISILLPLVQQLSGISAILLYSNDILTRAGLSKICIEFVIVTISIICLIASIVSIPITAKVGRRKLLLVSSLLMLPTLASLTAVLHNQWPGYIAIVAIFVYLICFSVGLGTVPMLVISEVGDERASSKLVGVASMTSCCGACLVSISFHCIQNQINENIYLVFAGCIALGIVLIYFKVPETNNQSFCDPSIQSNSNVSQSKSCVQKNKMDILNSELQSFDLPKGYVQCREFLMFGAAPEMQTRKMHEPPYCPKEKLPPPPFNIDLFDTIDGSKDECSRL